MKKILIAMIVLTMLAFCSCKGNDEDNSSTPSDGGDSVSISEEENNEDDGGIIHLPEIPVD